MNQVTLFARFSSNVDFFSLGMLEKNFFCQLWQNFSRQIVPVMHARLVLVHGNNSQATFVLGTRSKVLNHSRAILVIRFIRATVRKRQVSIAVFGASVVKSL